MQTVKPFSAAYYSAKNRQHISRLALPDLDTVEHLWGKSDSSLAFRNVLVGSPEQRGEIWQAWISSGEIELADEASFYILKQQSRVGTKELERWALLAAISLDSPKLQIHEDVLAEGVERARQATEACEGDMAPVFVGFDEAIADKFRLSLQALVTNTEPMLRFQENESNEHTLWKCSGLDIRIQNILQDLEARNLYLLDGHHRLAAAKENQRLGMGDGYILSCICSLSERDTLILPIHRLVVSDRWLLPDAFAADLVRAACRVRESTHSPADLPRLLENFRQSELQVFALHAHGNRLLEVELPKLLSLPPQLAELSVASLDNGVLHSLDRGSVMPSTDVGLALAQLAKDQAQVGFFLPSVLPRQVREVAKKGLRMPRKSTRFVPKPALGLVMRPWQL